MAVPRITRLATATAAAGASWLLLLFAVVEANSTSTALAVSAFTLFVAATSMWLVGILTERHDSTTFQLGGDSALRAQVVTTRALREVAGLATRADLFALLAEHDEPLSLKQIDRALSELERSGVVMSDFDDETGARTYRLAVTRRRLTPPAGA